MKIEEEKIKAMEEVKKVAQKYYDSLID